ncbi:MAG: hypothetical protein JXR86_10510 [Spirochaetales bacterium]|nr:hypothetical protein [Spirochaetales bacterium]
MTHFEEIEILNNFYQTSSFFPMPTVLISTLSPEGETNLGAYSLCFPYYIAEKDYFGMFLGARNSSNTAQNILRDRKCAINFLPDKKRYLKEIVRLGFPGEETSEKMRETIFHLQKGLRAVEKVDESFPLIISEAEQVFECTWDDSETIPPDGDGVVYHPPYNRFNGITSEHGAIFILKIDKILLRSKWKKALIEGSSQMPAFPVDYGFRNNAEFWISPFRKPLRFPIPKDKGVGEDVVRAAALKLNEQMQWDEECFIRLKRIPKIFLNTALKGILEDAENRGVSRITLELLDEIRDKRNKEKKYN